MIRLLAALALAMLVAGGARAHSASNAYLTLTADGAVFHAEWQLAVRDLDAVIGLDEAGTGTITWGAVRRHERAIAEYALGRLALSGDGGAACPPGEPTLLVDRHGDGAYAVLRFDLVCPAPPRAIALRYDAFFDRDALHRGLISVMANGTVSPAVFSPDARIRQFDLGGRLGSTFVSFLGAGIDHIASGLDHLLFIAMLLLPAGLGRAGQRPEGVGSAVAILSAFTVAHALSLAGVVLGFVQVPARLVEGAIALTIVATAIDNIVPILGPRRWPVAFGFGLIHGLGFASSLGPLGLPPVALAVALVAFNLGIELAQLSAVALVLPAGFLLRRLDWNRREIVPVTSAAVAMLALVWFVGREFPWVTGVFQ